MANHRSLTVPVTALAVIAAVLPLLTINICYLVAAWLQHVPLCVPYFSGCTTTSSTGRALPESMVFRAGMLPCALVVALFWHRCGAFLQVCGRTRSRQLSLTLLGVLAGLSLVLYTLVLGLSGDGYRLVRRIGIVGFFLANYAAQVLFVFAYRRNAVAVGPLRVLGGICIALPAMAIVGEFAKWSGAPRYPVNNVVEWNGLLVVAGYFAGVAWLWRQHGFVGVSPTENGVP